MCKEAYLSSITVSSSEGDRHTTIITHGIYSYYSTIRIHARFDQNKICINPGSQNNPIRRFIKVYVLKVYRHFFYRTH